MERSKLFSEKEIELLADAIWLRQKSFIAGDRKFKEYGNLLNEFLEDSNYVPCKFR